MPDQYLAAGGLVPPIRMGLESIDPFLFARLNMALAGHKANAFHVLGRRGEFVNAVDQQDIVDFNTASLITIPEMAGTENLEVVSSSANDAAAGTGVRTIRIVYVDANGDQQLSDAITLNGVTPVALSFKALAIQWAESYSVGSGGVAAGNIAVRNVAAPTTIYERISAGGNRSTSGRFMVPAGHYALLDSWDTHAIRQRVDFRLRATSHAFDDSLAPGIYLFKDSAYMGADQTAEHDVPWLLLPPLAKIKVSAIPDAISPQCRADISFGVLLIKHS